MAQAAHPPLPRELALRIGLAARALPDVGPKRLLELLIDKLGAPLTEQKLMLVTVTQLKAGLAGTDGEEDAGHVTDADIPQFKEAVRILWGGTDTSDLPQPQPYRDGDMPGSIRVAVASHSDEQANGHFGSCLYFLVYQVGPTEARLIELRSALEADHSDDRNAARAELIKDCRILYVVSIGGPAAAKVVKADIHPIKLNAEQPARQAIAQLQTVLAGSPPPWLAKIMGTTPELHARFAATSEAES